jgi:hypothetical protein
METPLAEMAVGYSPNARLSDTFGVTGFSSLSLREADPVLWGLQANLIVIVISVCSMLQSCKRRLLPSAASGLTQCLGIRLPGSGIGTPRGV